MLLFLSLSHLVIAQQSFSEGIVHYDVFADGSKEAIGKMDIKIKGMFLKYELKLNSGFQKTTIINGKEGSSATLNTVQNQPYALMLTKTELDIKNKKFENANYNMTLAKEKYAAFDCTLGKVLYSNGSSVNIALCDEFTLENPYFLAMFPNLKKLPLMYETENGSSTLRYVANSIDLKSIESEEFVVPKNYKIVTQKELDEMR